MRSTTLAIFAVSGGCAGVVGGFIVMETEKGICTAAAARRVPGATAARVLFMCRTAPAC